MSTQAVQLVSVIVCVLLVIAMIMRRKAKGRRQHGGGS